MATLPKISTIFSWLIYLVPLYIFVGAPILRQLLPASRGTAPPDEGVPNRDLHLSDDSFISREDGVPPTCPETGDNYRVHLLRREPLMMYIENFLSDEESDHLVEISVGNYTPSIVYDGAAERIDPSKRLSERALLARDNVVRCVEERARAFQGWQPHLYIERMWAQRYNISGHYGYHYDWAGTAERGGDRISTFMVYLSDECTGGGTNFPRIVKPEGEQWCQFLECDEDGGGGDGGENAGVTFRPIKGNAIFWMNLRPDGTGYPETWHRALPVMSGTKIGLNIWSWYQPPGGIAALDKQSRM